MTKTSQVSLVQQVFNAAVTVAKSDETLRLAVIAAGVTQESVRNMAIAGRISFSLNYTQERSLLALGKKGNPKHKVDVSDDVRSISEEKAYGAARVWWSARLKAWGLVTTASQGGDRTEAKDAMDTEKLVLPKKVKVETTIELGAMLLASAQSLYDFFLLNKAHSAVVSDIGSQMMGATADYLDAIKALQIKSA